MVVGWSLTALSTQFRSYRAFKVELYYKSRYGEKCYCHILLVRYAKNIHLAPKTNEQLRIIIFHD